MRRRYLPLAFVAAIGLAFAIPRLMPQDRLGATIWSQDTEPTDGLVPGQFWYAPTTNALKLLVGLNPSTWRAVPSQPAGTPTVSSCGSGASVAGNDMIGVISVGTGVVTGCTLTFNTPYVLVAPICTITPSSAVAFGATSTTTELDISLGVSLGSGKIAYHCIQRAN